MQALGELRFEPTPKRVSAFLDGAPVLDTARAVLVWEPRRIVPEYAVPEEDVAAELLPWDAPPPAPAPREVPLPSGAHVIPPGDFRAHTAAGEELVLRAGGATRPGAAFRLRDSEVEGLVLVSFHALDGWREEDEPIHGHPRDPFKRIDVRRSARRVRVEVEGRVLAESARPRLLFETYLPVRTYLPPDDVRMDLLRPSPTRTTCAYKGTARWLAVDVDGEARDVAWTYERPLSDATEVAGMVCFFDERVDAIVDGELRPRPASPWS